MAGDVFDDRLFVALLTPYVQGGWDVDEDQMRALMRRFVAAARDGERIGLVVVPEAGEIYYLTPEEKRRLLAIAQEEAAGQVPLLMGVSENTTAATVEAARKAVAAGVDGLFVMPPIGALDVTGAWDSQRYPEVFGDLLEEVAGVADGTPIVCHPTQRPTPQFGVGLPADVAVHLCERVPSIVAWKMTYSYNGYRTVTRALRGLDREVKLYASSAPFFHEYLASEVFDGSVSGALNYGLDLMLDHIHAWREEDLARARRLWSAGLAQLHEYVYADHARLHIRYKVATWLRGWIRNPLMRPPLPRPRREEIAELAARLRACGVEVIPDAEIEAVAGGLPA